MLENLTTMHNSPGRQDGAVVRRSSLFCSAAAFLRDARVGGFSAGILVLSAALIVALTAYRFIDSYIPLYILVAATMSGQIAHILACKRESVYGDLLEFCVHYAVLGLSLWLAVSDLVFPSILGVLVVFIGSFVGAKASALLRKKLRL
ncbi:MAG: hypothetical protein OXF50_24790 [Caldilineaceae bacterium]|nr:hypothetical protein [Caldilineaceae bacterium]